MKQTLFLTLLICLLALAACSAPPPQDDSTFTNVDLPTRPAQPTTATSAEAQTSPTAASAPAEASATPALAEASATPAPAKPAETQPPAPAATQPPAAPTAGMALAPAAWQELPVIPEISAKAQQIYQHGQELGNNPKAFSKIGDCGSTPTWFLGDFDRGQEHYRLGEYTQLESVIQEFQGSYDRTSLAARSGFNAASLFSPLWADRSQCQPNETPLACEYRVHKPAYVFIMLGANDVWHPENFEPQMRKIIEYSIENGVIPILSTKADNQEGDGSLNATLARLAAEYDVPLVNFWRATAFLPNRGLQEDNVHLTWGRNFFDDPQEMQRGWPIRNLTALQILDAIWRSVAAPAQ